jgi:hypothetical protein
VVSSNQMFTQLFEINWVTPYLLGYMLLAACHASRFSIM